MSYFVSFTADNGLTVGASGDSLVSALALLADEFGDEVIHLYAHARDDVAAALAGDDEINEEVRADLHRKLRAQRVDDDGPVGGASRPSGDDDAGGEAAERGGAGGSAGGAPAAPGADDSDAEPPPRIGGEAAGAPEKGGDAPAADDAARCTVCGEPLTSEMQKASRLMYGEDRCADCLAF